ncbi:MAG TPA: ABC-2 family transporter protein, partial [Caulobacteraceae bacterium]|nr:ABC-2 family transporter protein [Caulobacteraceae bacterium]
NADPDVAEMVRSGAVAYERLRPVDTYAWWYARALAWTAARIVPRAGLMFVTAAVLMPLVGLGRWGLRLPTDGAGAALFCAAIIAAALLSASMTVLLNIVAAASLTDRGANAFAAPISIVLSGSLVPLAFYPHAFVPFLRLQPFAGLIDTPFRVWNGDLAGLGAVGAIGLQLAWTLVLAILGRRALESVMARVQVQGG